MRDSFICGYVDFGAKSAIIPTTFTQMRKSNCVAQNNWGKVGGVKIAKNLRKMGKNDDCWQYDKND